LSRFLEIEFGREPVVDVALKTPKFSVHERALADGLALPINGYVAHIVKVKSHTAVVAFALDKAVTNSCLGEKVFTLGRHFPRWENSWVAERFGKRADHRCMAGAWLPKSIANVGVNVEPFSPAAVCF
jgi:hypothetical protein